ncbi:hypothetical protein ANO14919_128360 [Xylariales sp. No.14919]|nr:hypothetical protein ANO14919_128360 [Xylariales sp. No.14919]
MFQTYVQDPVWQCITSTINVHEVYGDRNQALQNVKARFAFNGEHDAYVNTLTETNCTKNGTYRVTTSSPV